MMTLPSPLHPCGCVLPVPQVLRKQGVEQYNPLGEKFDPNFHNALFEVPDGTKEVGHVAVVTKVGGACYPTQS